MKKKVLLSSIATIALCLCLITGSTFALFTSTDKVDISVKAAKVEMAADITNLAVASVRPATVAEVRAAAEGENITIIEDGLGGQYVYEKRNDGTFANGGTANFANAVLTLNRITPGDMVSFDIVGANTSDVTIRYRYVIECIDGQKLMSGMLISVEDVIYEFLGSYTSGWKALQPGTNMDTVPVVVEFPVTAGDEFQKLTTSIKVTVEAVQGNADVAGSNLPTVEFLDGISVDLAGRTLPINAGVVNTGTLELSNGAIAIDEVGFENLGTATLNSVVIDGGTPGKIAYGYGVIGRGEDSVTVLNDVTVNSANGAIGAADGAKVTFNSGDVEVGSAATSGRYLFYAEGENTVITINDGNFSVASKLSNGNTQNNKRAYICAIDGATVYVTGGTFGTAPFRNTVLYPDTNSKYSDGIVTNKTGTVIITGGTFGFDPTKWVADGYQAIKNDSTWYVVPETVDVVVNEASELLEAIYAGHDNIKVYNVDFTENALGNGAINYHKNADVTFVNCTFTGNNNYNYIRNATYIGCTFDCGANNAAMHFDELFGTLTVTDCTFVSGKVQIGTSANASAIFTNCTFGETATTSIWAEKGIRVYSPATFNNCEFKNRVVLAGDNNGNGGLALTFNGCTMEDGRPVYYVDNTDGIIRGGNIPTVTIND